MHTIFIQNVFLYGIGKALELWAFSAASWQFHVEAFFSAFFQQNFQTHIVTVGPTESVSQMSGRWDLPF